VLDMVDVDSAKWAALSRQTRGPRGWIYRREAACLAPFESRAALKSYATLVVNEREQAEVMKLAPTARTLVVRNGVDIEFFRPTGPPADSARVVFCGVFNYAPNEEAALWFMREVWPAILKARTDSTLVLVGSHPTRALRDAASRAGRVEVTGAVPDVRPYLWGSALSIAPIWTARGVQNKVLEAAAAGLPSVVTPAVMGGLPTHVLPACSVAGTADAFSASVLALLALSPEERRAAASLADLSAMRWNTRLAPLIATLEAAAHSNHHVSAPAMAVPSA
jgi:hypothetical protein